MTDSFDADIAVNAAYAHALAHRKQPPTTEVILNLLDRIDRTAGRIYERSMFTSMTQVDLRAIQADALELRRLLS